jgi:hypothetical protein
LSIATSIGPSEIEPFASGCAVKQAPTLIGCFVVKERPPAGIPAYPVLPTREARLREQRGEIMATAKMLVKPLRRGKPS